MTATMPTTHLHTRLLVALVSAALTIVLLAPAADAAPAAPTDALPQAGTESVSSSSLATASAKYSVTGAFSTSTFVGGEMVWVRGAGYLNGSKKSGLTITLYRKKDGSSTWSSVASTKTTSVGHYNFRFSPSSLYSYRTRVAGTSAYSKSFRITGSGADRSLEFRSEQLASTLGAPTAGAHDVDGAKLPSGVTAARYRTFERGTLVEVTRDGKVRTWLVYDRIGTKYKDLDRWDGRLGLPTRDPKCGLLESGCVQRFTGGSVYVNGASMSPGTYVAYGTGVESELLAVGYSQAGYEEPAWRINKYTKWLGSRPAWCMTFVAWVATASGNAHMVPKSGSYESYLKTLKASGRLHYDSVPPAGAIALFDWGNGTPSHTGFITSRSGNYLRTIEGNTSNGTSDPQRGVYKRERHISYVWAWYWPSDV